MACILVQSRYASADLSSKAARMAATCVCARARARGCVCVCVRAYVCGCVCVCVCVCVAATSSGTTISNQLRHTDFSDWYG